MAEIFHDQELNAAQNNQFSGFTGRLQGSFAGAAAGQKSLINVNLCLADGQSCILTILFFAFAVTIVTFAH